ncbi:hypothetical protein [Devosia nitrariae]|uniref:Uncharacterized protein n=1 Tax=Devosia nitrariae TaxID=2071872 RepID=A0ABQ5W5Z1_9HYPH|nr:hypothetical protein [Devosia nitrariae]GLQ55030.1 hypothetical protein GCM10010862_22890 [Devosia nitrariae]
MFLVRSAFWLTVAFLVIKPGIDLDKAAGDLSNQALSAGRQVIAQSLTAEDCDSLACVGGKAVIAAAIADSAPSVPAAAPVPLPRPRPERAG